DTGLPAYHRSWSHSSVRQFGPQNRPHPSDGAASRGELLYSSRLIGSPGEAAETSATPIPHLTFRALIMDCQFNLTFAVLYNLRSLFICKLHISGPANNVSNPQNPVSHTLSLHISL